jgi:peptidoglycan-N-acetylglucosamine deacetylase
MTCVVTTSWDDGHVLDLRVADLLDRYGVAGTFYVAPECVELEPAVRLDSRQIRHLAEGFEIGGHTLTHPRLPELTAEAANREIVDGKEHLEAIIQKPLRSFCYPGGEYRLADRELVQRAGFRIARTVERFVTTPPGDPLQLATSVHAYRHWRDLPRAIATARRSPGRAAKELWGWDALATGLFDRTLATGGVFHLWGHSWEIDAHDDWGRLESVLAHLGRRPEVEYLVNGELDTAA